jgi:hypothetical protein
LKLFDRRQLSMWVYWAAFAVVMLWVLGVSWAWALNVLPTNASSAIVIVAVCAVCIVEGIALCVLALRASGQPQQRAVHNQRADDNEDKAEKSVANATWMIFVATAVNVIIATLQWNAISTQATIMEADQRPWVHFTNALPEDPGLQVVPEGMGISVRFFMRNVGRTPAKFAIIAGEMKVATPAEYGNPDFASCEQRRRKPRSTVKDGIPIFPNQESPMRVHFGMKADQVGKLKTFPISAVVIYGCLDYLFPIGDAHHQTRFFYEIDKKGPNQTFVKIDPDNPPIGVSAIDLAINPGVAGDAD